MVFLKRTRRDLFIGTKRFSKKYFLTAQPEKKIRACGAKIIKTKFWWRRQEATRFCPGHFRINFCQSYTASYKIFGPLIFWKNIHPLDDNGVFEENSQRSFHRHKKFFENVFFEAWRLRKRLQMIVFIAAIVSVKISSKSELSSRFFGRLKFSARFEYLSLNSGS